MATRNNPLYQEYMRVRRNAQSRYYRLKKKGLTFNKNPIPSIPKNITNKSIEKVNQLTTEKLKSRATSSAKRGSNRTSINLPNIIDKVLNQVESEIDRWTPPTYWSDWLKQHKENTVVNPMKNMLNGAIASEGRRAVAMRLEKQASSVIDIVNQLLYGSGGKGHHVEDDDRTNLVAFAVIIKGRSLTPDESIEATDYMDSF